MKTLKLKDILPSDVSARLARAKLRKAYAERKEGLPERVSSDWEFPLRDRSKVMRIITR